MGMCNSSPVLSSIRSKAVSMFSLQFSPACDTLSKRQTAGNLGGSGSICGGILMANHPVAMQGLNPNCQSYFCLNRCSLTHWVLRAVFFCSIIQHLQSLVSLWYIELAYSTLEVLCRPTWLTILGFIFSVHVILVCSPDFSFLNVFWMGPFERSVLVKPTIPNYSWRHQFCTLRSHTMWLQWSPPVVIV